MGTKALSGANAKHGRVFIAPFGSTFPTGYREICPTEWSITEMVQEEETTNSCSAGKREYEYGIRHCEGNLNMDLDLSEHPLDNPPNLRVGTKLAARFYEHSAPASTDVDGDGKYWDFTAINITNMELTEPQNALIKYNFTWKSTGAYTSPDENAGSSG